MSANESNPAASSASNEVLEAFEGEISALAVLDARNRRVREILIDRTKDPEATLTVRNAAREHHVRVAFVDASEIGRVVQGTTHGGIVALAGPRVYPALADTAVDAGRGEWYAMLDGVEDPFNFGQAARALYAAGAAGLVLRPRTWRGGDGVVARPSAGATELMPTAHVETLDDALAHFQSRGFRVAVTARDARAVSIYDTVLTGPLFVLIGGEKRGLKRALIDRADLVLRIPYSRRFPHSLGSAGSASVLAFEIMRQRMKRTADG